MKFKKVKQKLQPLHGIVKIFAFSFLSVILYLVLLTTASIIIIASIAFNGIAKSVDIMKSLRKKQGEEIEI